MTELSERYGCAVKAEIATMYLGFIMGALKQVAACKEAWTEKKKCLQEIVHDAYLQDVFTVYDASSEPCTKKALFWALRKKSVGLCYALAWARNLKG